MPETPGRPVFPVENVAITPQSSPFLPPPHSSIPRPSTARKKTDPLLHRVLDRNYRVQATPLTTQRYANGHPRITAATTKGARNVPLSDTTFSSSPAAPPPELDPEIFSSPERKRPVPGVSVLTPARGKTPTSKAPTQTPGIWDSDDDDLDDDLVFGQSPPKTMQFHVPQNRLLKTPGRSPRKPSQSYSDPDPMCNSKRGIETNCARYNVNCRNRLRRRRDRFQSRT